MDNSSELASLPDNLKRKQKGMSAESALANLLEIKNKCQFLAENIRDVIFIEDNNLNLVYLSPSAEKLFGFSVEEGLKKKKQELMTPESYNQAMEDFQYYFSKAMEDRNVEVPLLEYEYVRKDGSTFWGELKVSFLYDDNGNIIGSQGVLRNIDERKSIEEELRKSKFKFLTMFDLSPQAIALTDVETGKIKEVNRKFCEVTNLSKDQIIGKTAVELGFYSTERRRKFIEELIQAGEISGLQMDFNLPDGSVIDTLVFARLIKLSDENLILSIILDLTQQKRLEAMLRHAQKMEAVGTLAGGIAHDFNNMLQGIFGYTQILLLNKDPSHPDYEKIKAIETTIRRGAELTKRLLIYARRVDRQVRTLNLNDEIMQVCKLLERAVTKTVNIELDLEPDLKLIRGDASELEQVLMNLCVNARDAMPEGGKLKIETKNVILDRKFCKSHPGAREGEYVLLAVSDTGHGIDHELMDHIFEPFFTTKETGKGTGLGLAIVYGIVKDHKGYITCYSSPNKGTTFKIYLPVSKNHSQEQAISWSREERPMLSGTETILVVDDEEVIRKSSRAILEHFGYTVILAESGEQALEILKRQPNSVHLVIMDLAMPGMGGKRCIERILELEYEVKIIVASGYSPDKEEKRYIESNTCGFVQKPFEVDTFVKKIRTVLG